MNQNSTKRGVASLYVVIFATILFGVVTLSFMRIILSEAGQTSDDDLSRSAYDSAMAGVEDAKTAINRCLTQGGGSNCNELFSRDCQNGIGIAKILYPASYGVDGNNGEVKLQENSQGSDPNNNSDQAYTCVVVSDEVPDYRGTLTSDTRTKMVPLAVYNSDTGNSTPSGVNRISFDWYSLLNEGNKTQSDFQLASGVELGAATTPPTITLTIIKMSSGVTSSDFNNANDTSKLIYDTVVLLPSNNGTDKVDLRGSGNVNKEESNSPVPVSCSSSNSEFACHVDITGFSTDSSDSLFLVVSLPYGDTTTDFAATMYDNTGIVSLKGAQISIDSTGRTNQLVRRVETRLDPADLYFPYPQYELELTGNGGDDGLKKDFWITANCWKSSGGSATKCDNNGTISN